MDSIDSDRPPIFGEFMDLCRERNITVSMEPYGIVLYADESNKSEAKLIAKLLNTAPWNVQWFVAFMVADAAMKEQKRPKCVVCGFPPDVTRLIRLTLVNDAPQEPDDLRVILVKNPKPNDIFVCEECIRDIKRLSLTTITSEGQHVFRE